MANQIPLTDLPIENVVSELRSHLLTAQRAVLVAEPGAGKSTVVPLRLLDEPWLNGSKILVLEPRRLAAKSVARRMAEISGTVLGELVGYRTRDDSITRPSTRIEVITEGILTRRLQHDPELPDVAAVVFDEFHERSVHADLGLALTLDAAETVRPDLRLLVMSATINAEKVAELLGEESPAPIVDCPGRTYPVEVRWRPRSRRQRLEDATVSAVEEAIERHEGDVLVFLPGVGEITRVVKELDRRMREVAVFPLHGSLDVSAQEAALRANPLQRRVVVSTDVAETSLTVEGVKVVVDSGVARRPRFDPATGLTKLVTIEHSKASAEQRSGRAGRVCPGVAIRLWSKSEHAVRRAHQSPEISQIDLTSVVLEAATWGAASLSDLRLLDQPAADSEAEAKETLRLLRLLDDEGRPTDEGRAVAGLPLPPRLGAMVHLSGDGPMGWTACLLAALLSERDVVGGRPQERPCDLWTRVELIQNQSRSHPRQDARAIRTVRQRVKDIARRVGANKATVHPADIGRTLALAYPDRLAQNRGGKGGRFRLRSGIGAAVDSTDSLALEPMVVVAELSGEKRNPRIRLAAGIDALDVEMSFGSEVVERHFFGWDAKRDDVKQRIERRLGALDFGSQEVKIQPSSQVVDVLVDRIQQTDLNVLSWTKKARQLQRRVSFIRENDDSSDLPDLSDRGLVIQASKLFPAWLGQATGRSDVENLNMVEVLKAELGWDNQQLVDSLAPTSYQLPSGRQVTIDYEVSSPAVSVRVQEVYGVRETPTLLAGRVPLTFVLLSPAQRPIQTTSDLGAFWLGSWREVRKDMAGRYPKHDWPEHP